MPVEDLFGNPVYSKEELKEITAKEKQEKKELDTARKSLKSDLNQVLTYLSNKTPSVNETPTDGVEDNLNKEVKENEEDEFDGEDWNWWT